MTEHFDLTNLPEASVPLEPVAYWMKDARFTPYESDRKHLLGGEWLSGSIITAAQELLKDAYLHIGGLQPPLRGNDLTYEVEEGDVQIIHVSGNHWITVANLDDPHTLVKVYDRQSGKW